MMTILTIYLIGCIIAIIIEYIMNIYVEKNNITLAGLITLLLFSSLSWVAVIILLAVIIMEHDFIIFKAKK